MTSHDPLNPHLRDERVASWGTPPPRATSLARRIARQFARATGAPLRQPPARRTGPPAIPASRLDGTALEQLSRHVEVLSDDVSRRALSLGKSYPDLVAARGPRLQRACDAVARPRHEDQLVQVLGWCAAHDVAVVPVGGGTSVAGGVEPLGRTPDQPVLAVDVSAMSTCLDVDRRGRVATFEAGIRGPALEAVLEAYGLTLGHVPQSFELATLGGWIATRSAGQQSLAYGKVERMVGGLRVVTPDGTVQVDHLPAHGAGPDPAELFLGSEGTLGIISSATVRLAPRPSHVRFCSFLFRDFASAANAARELVQRGLRPATVRVSDEAETAFSIASSLPGSLPQPLAARAARAAGYGRGSLVMVVIPGTRERAWAIERAVASCMRECGGRTVGPTPARHWYHSRFLQPYARDLLIDRGLLVDTLETAAPWGQLEALHADVRGALEAAVGGPGSAVVGCHLSHLYADGASLYFTFLAPARPGAEIEQWRAAKRAAHAAIARHRGATSHQHGVGTMHADLYRERVPQLVRETLLAARGRLDATGIMNPGKCYLDLPGGVVPLNAVEEGPARERGAPKDAPPTT